MRRQSLGSHVGVGFTDPIFFTHQKAPSFRRPVPPIGGRPPRRGPPYGGRPARLRVSVSACLRVCVSVSVSGCKQFFGRRRGVSMCASVSVCLRVCVSVSVSESACMVKDRNFCLGCFSPDDSSDT